MEITIIILKGLLGLAGGYAVGTAFGVWIKDNGLRGSSIGWPLLGLILYLVNLWIN